MKAKPAKKRGEVVLQVSHRDDALIVAAEREAAHSPFAIKSVLVPIDFSDCSSKALQYALPFAKQHGATVTLLYVVAPLPYVVGEYGGLQFASLEADVRREGLKHLVDLATKEVNGTVPCVTEVRSGPPATEIVEAAKKLNTDLIVISTHGHTGLKHVLMGSVAEQVVRRAPCPVLVVREREHEFVTPS